MWNRSASVVSATVAWCAFALVSGSCAPSNSDPVLANDPSLRVEPSAFLGRLPCGPYPGAARSYVATLFDVTGPNGAAGGAGAAGAPSDTAPPAEINLASSPPTPCTLAVGFRLGAVVAGHGYRGEIDVYDLDVCPVGLPANRGAACIRPLGANEGGAFTAGGRAMVDGDRRIVAPKWSAYCGGPPGAPDVESATIVDLVANKSLANCAPIVTPEAGINGPGRITVDFARLVARDARTGRTHTACASSPDLVFSVALGPAPAPANQHCDDVFVSGDLPAGRAVVFAVTASEVGHASGRFTTTCSAVPQPGVTLPASCDLLSN